MSTDASCRGLKGPKNGPMKIELKEGYFTKYVPQLQYNYDITTYLLHLVANTTRFRNITFNTTYNPP